MFRTAAAGRRAFVAGLGATLVGVPRRARAESVVTVGLVLPRPSPVATAIERGATLGLDDANALATAFGKRLRLEVQTAGDAGDAGRALVRAGAIAVVGGHDASVVETLADASAPALVLNVGADDDRLRTERCARHVFHLAPSAAMGADALVGWLARQRGALTWAIEADGSPRARVLESAFRRALARRNARLVPPEEASARLLALADAALGPAVARARAAGQGDAVAGLDDAVVATAGPDDAAGLWVVGWHHELERFSARELNRRFTRRFSAPFDTRSWAAWAAVKLVGEAVVRASATDAAGVAAFLLSAPPFDGHKGAALTFRPWDHQLRQPLYVMGARPRAEIGERRGPFALRADVPGPDLDAIGTGKGETRCGSG